MPPGLKKWDFIPPCANLAAIADASGEYNNSYFNANATLGYRINF